MTPGRRAALALPVALYALPLALALPVALVEATDAAAWHSLLADPQGPRALALSVGSAVASTLLALAACLALVTHAWGTPYQKHFLLQNRSFEPIAMWW